MVVIFSFENLNQYPVPIVNSVSGIYPFAPKENNVFSIASGKSDSKPASLTSIGKPTIFQSDKYSTVISLDGSSVGVKVISSSQAQSSSISVDPGPPSFSKDHLNVWVPTVIGKLAKTHGVPPSVVG